MKKTMKFAPGLMLIFASVISLSACSATPSKQTQSKTSSVLTQPYVWYDGSREQTVWLNPQVVAEFNPSEQSTKVAKGVDAQARMVTLKQSQHGVRFWQMQNPAGAALRSLAISNPTGKYSPVFHDSASSTGSMRALPGNIIVYLNPGWDAATVHNWIAAHKLELVKKLEIGINIYVFKTAPGLDAMNTANALYQSGEVVAAFPDWWKEISTR